MPPFARPSCKRKQASQAVSPSPVGVFRPPHVFLPPYKFAMVFSDFPTSFFRLTNLIPSIQLISLPQTRDFYFRGKETHSATCIVENHTDIAILLPHLDDQNILINSNATELLLLCHINLLTSHRPRHQRSPAPPSIAQRPAPATWPRSAMTLHRNRHRRLEMKCRCELLSR